jgi:hypothetical protein
VADLKRSAKMKASFAALPEGFSLESRGRSGCVFFRERNRVLELYWEISGVEDYDWLLSLEPAKAWTHPKEEKITESKRREILDALERWLVSKKIRSDAFGPKSGALPRG